MYVQNLVVLNLGHKIAHFKSRFQSAVPPRCKNPGEFPRCVSLRPRPRAPAPASAPPRKAPRAGLLSYTSRERKCRVLHVTSKRVNTSRVEKKLPRADSSPSLGWAGLFRPLREGGRVRCSRSHFHAAMCVWVAVLSFFVKGHDSQLVAYRGVST